MFDKLYPLAILLILLLTSCNTNNEESLIIDQSRIKHKNNRVAAEWEPALGAIVVWPLDLPHKLIIELAKDAKLYTIVPNKEEIEIAKTWYVKWGIDLSNVEFIISSQGLDSWWARDWGAFAVFDSLGAMSLADGQYKYSTPITTIGCNDSLQFLFAEEDKTTGKNKIILTTQDDDTPIDIAKHMSLNRIDLPFTYTGGNVFMDGKGSAISCCIIKNENNYIGVDETKFINYTETYLGITNYSIISNFEHRGIQHIDCLLKMLDNNRLFVMQPPKDHPNYQIYEDIVNNELSQKRTADGKKYEILRLSTARYKDDRLAAYSNSLILNKTIYVPKFGIAQDSIALQQWAAAMPGYTVKGFEYNVKEEPMLHPRVLQRRISGLGWKDGDALHCRTRAMWDPQMLYITFTEQAKKIGDAYHFEAKIIDYSNSGLKRKSLQLLWREKGSDEWNANQLSESSVLNQYHTSIANISSNKEIEYYITATSANNNTQCMPITAPIGFYSIITE